MLTSQIETFGILEKIVKVADINVHVKFLVVPETTMSAAAFLDRDFTTNPAIKIVIEQGFKIMKNNLQL